MATSRKNMSPGCLLVFLVPFMLMGLGIIYGLGIRPMQQVEAAKQWTQVPCTITAANLHESTDSDGDTTYRVEVTYTYTVAGQEYSSDRESFTFGSTNIGVEGMQERVSRYQQNPQQVCYVDPADPHEAVLERETPDMMWFGYIFGGVFAGFPFLILIFVMSAARRSRRRTALGEALPLSDGKRVDSRLANRLSNRASTEPVMEGPLVLKTTGRHGCGVLFLLFFTIVWNAIVWTIASQADGEAQWFLYVFQGIGAILGLVFLYQLLSLFNARPLLELVKAPLRPGQSTDLRLSWVGNSRSITHLTVTLICVEEAVYQRGTDSITDRSEWSNTVLYDSMEAEANITARIAIPADALASFDAPHNRIIWKIKIHGVVPRFPDLKREFIVPVLPPPNHAVAQSIAPSTPGEVIRLDAGRQAFRPGDMISGQIRWSLAGARKQLSLRLFWFTAGRGTVDVQVVAEHVISAPAESGEESFALEVPPQGPLSIAGRLVSVAWALELVAEPGGVIERVDLMIGPDGTLRGLPPEPPAAE